MKNLTLLLLCIGSIGCAVSESLEDQKHFNPRWFFIGWSCDPESSLTDAAPICNKEGSTNVLYAGSGLVNGTNDDGWCGWPNSGAAALDTYLTWGITDISMIEAARCIIAGSQSHGLYRCSMERDGCYCLYYYEFASREQFQSLFQQCAREYPGHHP